MYRVFQTLEDYNNYTSSGTNLTAGDIYIVKGTKALFFNTNNLDGEPETYDYLDEIPEGYIIPTGNKTITENGNNIDVTQYASASVNVPIPEGYIVPSGNTTITENGNVDVTQYASASVAVPIPEGYIIPTGNKTITENGNNIDVSAYATATVNVPVPEGYIVPTGNKSITANGENIDVSAYATATVNVAGSGGQAEEDLKNLIEGDITSLDIPSGTTSIHDNAFYKCSSLSSVNIPSGVTSIGVSAFYGCSSLTSITIPNSVTSIGQSAFRLCSGLTSVTIGSGVTTIDNNAFNGCSGLISVTIGNSVTSIGKDVFYGCGSLTSVTVEATTPPSLGANAFANNASGRKIYVPAASVNAYKAATNWSAYSSDIKAIPETRVVATFNVTDVESETGQTQLIGYNATSLFDEIEIDGVVQPSVRDVVYYMFDTTGEHTVKYTLKDNTSIGQYAFNNCTSLESITIPNNVTSIGNMAFEGCSSLPSVTIPDSVTSIGQSAFDLTGLESITIPNSVTSIGNMAFQSCEGLTSVTIGSGVTSIGNSAFFGCSSLASIDIPSGVTSIGQSAFDMTGLESVTVEATTPPTLGFGAFDENEEGRKIYVPAESVDAYKTAENWSEYAEDIEAIPT